MWAAQRCGLFYTPLNWHLSAAEAAGQRVHAVVQPALPGSGTPELAAELIDFCRSRIVHYKAPRSVSFEDELPRLPSGKMLRRLLMDRYRAVPPS